MPGFYYSQALLPSRHASFLHLGALHYLPGGLYVFFAPCCSCPSGRPLFHVYRTLLSALLLVGYIPSWYNTFDRARPPQHPRSGILFTFLAGLIT